MFVSLFDTDLIFLFTDIYTQIFMLCCLKSMNHPLPLYATKLRPWFHPPPLFQKSWIRPEHINNGDGGATAPSRWTLCRPIYPLHISVPIGER